MRKFYSDEFKQKMVSKLLLPGGPSFAALSDETSVHITSLRQWVKDHANGNSMSKKNKTLQFGVEEKFQILMETSSLKENELGEYLRKKGLHSAQLEEWKQGALLAMKTSSRPYKIDPELSELRNKEKNLQKEIQRKDKALAEMAARVILLKKSRLIWGDAEEDE